MAKMVRMQESTGDKGAYADMKISIARGTTYTHLGAHS